MHLGIDSVFLVGGKTHPWRDRESVNMITLMTCYGEGTGLQPVGAG